MTGLDDGKIARKAFEWSEGYKPFNEGLRPQEYAAYGYEQGYKQAMADKAKSFEEGGQGKISLMGIMGWFWLFWLILGRLIGVY